MDNDRCSLDFFPKDKGCSSLFTDGIRSIVHDDWVSSSIYTFAYDYFIDVLICDIAPSDEAKTYMRKR